MPLEPLELRDRRYRAQKALNLLKSEEDAAERATLEEEIAHYQEICVHEHAEDVEGQWRCKDCDLQKTTAVPEPDPAPEPEEAAAAEPEAEASATPAKAAEAEAPAES